MTSESSPNSFLVAIDGSKNADSAFDFALTHSTPKDKIHIVTSRQSSAEALVGDFLAIDVLDDEHVKKDTVFTTALLQSYKDKCTHNNRNCSFQRLEYSGGSSSIAESICRAALEHNAHIIVGSRGLNPLSRVMLGSVSHHIVNNCPASVTVVKNPQHKE